MNCEAFKMMIKPSQLLRSEFFKYLYHVLFDSTGKTRGKTRDKVFGLPHLFVETGGKIFIGFDLPLVVFNFFVTSNGQSSLFLVK